MPPGHGKTELCRHAVARTVGRRPDLKNVYATYSADFAREHSRAIRRYTEEIGVEFDKTANRQEAWHTTSGGGLYAVGVGGPLTGRRCTGIGVVDDPFKDPQEANSPAIREHRWKWFAQVLMTRLLGNASVLVVHTRWHVDDLIGRLERMGSWEIINIPAFSYDENGERRALMPHLPPPPGQEPIPDSGFPLSILDERKDDLGAIGFAALYMGQPRPEGGRLFEGGAECLLADIPTVGQVAIGVDLAYTKRTYADFSTAVVLRRAEGKTYVERVIRVQEHADTFVNRLQALSAEFPTAPLVWHGSQQESGAAMAIKALGLANLKPTPAKVGKLERALGVAASWRRGEIYVPKDASWVRPFLAEIENFTGVGDRHDDQVDALASAFSALPKAGKRPPSTRGRRATAALRSSY